MLDYSKLGDALAAIQEVRAARQEREAARKARLLSAYAAASGQHAEIVARAARDKESIQWTIGIPVAPLGPAVPVARISDPYAIVATDGSTLDPDAHLNPDYYMVNIGVVRLVYGPGYTGSINSIPTLECAPEKLWIGTGSRSRPKGAREVALERDIAEIEGLVKAMAEVPDTMPRVAMVDGSLIRWDLESMDAGLRDPFLERYVASLNACEQSGVPVVGYIAASQSRELVNFLRLAICPHDPSPCEGDELPCSDLNGSFDYDLLKDLLAFGERGPILRSQAKVLDRYAAHPIYSTTLHVGPGIVRLEFPEWVISAGKLDMVLSVILDQCRKGAGYPPVLQEAHEAAVLSGGDRSSLRAWVEQVTNQRRTSAKAASKRTKRI